jgi:hypothetical protein
MTPDAVLRSMTEYLKELEEAKRLEVKVGLPADKVGGQIYGKGQTIVSVGAAHEFGAGGMPARSFLRMPHEMKKEDIKHALDSQFEKIFLAQTSASVALGRIGVMAVNISREAFKTQGFGQWPALEESTKEIKKNAGKQNMLIWSGLLRNSITWSVGDAS